MRDVPGWLKFSSAVLLVLPLLAACGGPPQNPSLDGEGPAVLALDYGSSGDFGSIPNLVESQQTLQIINLSFTATASNINVAEGLVAPFTFTGGSYPGTGGTCTSSLGPGATCTIVVSAIPSAEGNFSDSITLEYNDSLANQSFTVGFSALSVTAQPAQLVISDAPNFDFGLPAIGTDNDHTFLITNTGDLPATALNPAALASPFSIVSSTCGAALSGLASCGITVRFTPINTTPAAVTLTLNYHDGVSPQTATRDIIGQGRIAANLTIVEGTSFDFGTINSGFFVEQTLTVQNNGGEPATAMSFIGLAAPYSFSGGSYPGLGGNCGTSLLPSASCTIRLRFAPTSTNLFNNSPILQYNDSFLVQNINFSLTGIGFANAVVLTRTSPATSPNTIAAPTIRVSSLISGVTVHLYSNAGCGNLVGSLSASGINVDFTPTMAEGSYEFHARVEDDYGNLSSCSLDSAVYEYDNTPPLPVTNVSLASQLTAVGTSTPSFSWTHSASADRTTYEVGLSTSPLGGNDVGGWQVKGLVTSTVMNGLSLTECQDLFASVRVIDQVGLISTVAATPTTFRYDSAVPTTPTGLNVDGDATPTNAATTHWNASTDNCGIDHYEIAISEDVNGNLLLDPGEVGNVVPFKDVGLVTSYRENGLLLNTATNYYTSVRAVDSSGRVSAVAVSPPYIIYNPSVELPAMIVWLDAADFTTVLDSAGRNASNPMFNGTVRNWQDKSGSPVVHNFSRSTGASQDALYNDANYSLQFNGINNGFTTPDHPEINNATVTQRNITVAFRTSGNINSRQVVYEEGGNVRGMNIYIETGRLICGFYNTPAGDGDGVQNFTWVETPIATNSLYFVTWVFDYTNYSGPSGPDGNLDCYVNNAHIGNVPSTSRLFAHSGNVGLGMRDNDSCYIGNVCSSGNGDFFLGEIFEVMLFNNAPNATDVSNVHTYLDNKWN